MSYASFTNLPPSTRFPAHSAYVARAAPASAGRGRLAAVLVMSAATEFLFVALAAYFAAVLYHRLCLQSLPDSARYVPESLLTATLDLLVSIGLRKRSRVQTQPRHALQLSAPAPDNEDLQNR